MTTSLLLIERIKVLCRDLIKGKRLALNRTLSYEVKLLPAYPHRERQQSPLSGLPVLKLVAVAAAPRPSSRSDRLRRENQGSRREAEHTRSNLG